MYLNFYGLREKPFSLTPDPKYFFMSPVHENAYTYMEYALVENKGFVVISGEIGAGKTILINYLVHRLPRRMVTRILNHTNIEPAEFLKMICKKFEIDVNGKDRLEMLSLFHNFLMAQLAEEKRVLLIIDEAQSLPTETLEQIRMLSNLGPEKHNLMQIALVGQPELREKLKQQNLRQLAQRVTVHCHIKELNPADVERYISHRLRVAGAKDTDIFSKDTMQMIYKYSGGIPRAINALCDAALVYGFADDLRRIDKKVIQQVVREMPALCVRPAPIADSMNTSTRKAVLDIDHLNRIALLENQVHRLLYELPRQMQDQKNANIMFGRKLVDILKELLLQERQRTKMLRRKIEFLERRVDALERDGTH